MDWANIPMPAETMASRDIFMQQFGSIYEHSPWVAEAAWDDESDRTGWDYGQLAMRMQAIVDHAPADMRLALLRAHPELASKAALGGDLTEDSQREQSGAGLDQCSQQELTEIRKLNAQYNARFGFPFIIAVTGLNRRDIIAAMRSRVNTDEQGEFDQAITQVHKIASIRLAAMAKNSKDQCNDKR